MSVIGDNSIYSLLDLILEDLNSFLNTGNIKYDLSGESNEDDVMYDVNNMLYNWLTLFDDYEAFSDEDKALIEQEIGETIGDYSIWTHEDEERRLYRQMISHYLNGNSGFFKVFIKIYEDALEKEWYSY